MKRRIIDILEKEKTLLGSILIYEKENTKRSY